MKIKIILIVIAILFTACTPAMEPVPEPSAISPDSPVTSPPQVESTPGEPMKNPFSPQPDDAKLERGEVFIEESGILIRESYPPQISLSLSGNLPTPCHQLRVNIGEPDEQNRIHADAYTVVDPNLICTQVIKPFSANIDLGTFPSGHYTVWVNGQSVGEFDS